MKASITQILFRSSIAALVLMLGACSTTSSTTSLKQKDSSLDAANYWTAQGKIGFKTPSKAQSANFIWDNTGENYHIQLFGPFGHGRVHIEKRDTHVELRRNGELRKAESAQALLQQETGIVMPIHWLQFWILGQPSPEQRFSDPLYDMEDRLSSFRQGEWQISYLRHEHIDGSDRPTKMTLNHPDYKLTVIVKSWSR
jgi:outer membrane lipoprotein LolB